MEASPKFSVAAQKNWVAQNLGGLQPPSPPRPVRLCPGGLFISNSFGVGENLFNLAKMVVLVLHKEAESNVENSSTWSKRSPSQGEKNRSEIPSRE